MTRQQQQGYLNKLRVYQERRQQLIQQQQQQMQMQDAEGAGTEF